jgi:hypothetical protein
VQCLLHYDHALVETKESLSALSTSLLDAGQGGDVFVKREASEERLQGRKVKTGRTMVLSPRKRRVVCM